MYELYNPKPEEYFSTVVPLPVFQIILYVCEVMKNEALSSSEI